MLFILYNIIQKCTYSETIVAIELNNNIRKCTYSKTTVALKLNVMSFLLLCDHKYLYNHL